MGTKSPYAPEKGVSNGKPNSPPFKVKKRQEEGQLEGPASKPRGVP